MSLKARLRFNHIPLVCAQPPPQARLIQGFSTLCHLNLNLQLTNNRYYFGFPVPALLSDHGWRETRASPRRPTQEQTPYEAKRLGMARAESGGQGLHHGVVIQSRSQLCEFCRVARSSIHNFHNTLFTLSETASSRMQVRCVCFLGS